MVLFQIWPLIYLFFWQYRRGKCVLRCCRTKKAFVRYKNKKSKSRKIEKWHFPIFFLKAIQARNRCFTIFQKGKTPFYAIKTRSSKSPRIEIFSKGLTHGFGPKLAIFSIFFVKAIQAYVFYDILAQLKKSQNWDLSKGDSPWFCSNIGNVFTFCLFQGNLA